MTLSKVAFNPLENERIDQVDYKESADSRVESAALDLIRQIDHPDEYGLSPDRISNLPEREARLVKQAAAGTGVVSIGGPNVAFAVIRLALMIEGIGGRELQDSSGKIKTHLNKINLLQNLNDLLPADVKDSYELTPEMKKCIEELKKAGVDIWKGGSKVSKAEDGKLHAQTSSKIAECRGLIEEEVRGMGITANKLERILKIVQKFGEEQVRGAKKANDSIPR